MAEEGAIDQEVYDQLIAEGKSERIARAKAKAAAIRKSKEAAGETLGPRAGAPAPDTPAAAAAAPAPSAAAASAAPAAAAATATAAPARLTPEERQARVAASLGDGGNGGRVTIGVPSASEHTHRLLALVPPDGIQQVQTKQADKVYTWPHLLAIELVALLAMTALLLVISYFIDAPLRALANPNLTPNPSKAPWYFLGLQELLRYFHPMVAGVTIPTVAMVMLAATPYFDKNPSSKPENRKFANMAFTFFIMFWAMLVLAGSFFRGPGFNWVWPWVDGLFFEL